ncbi:hypothetical protein B0H10DRAFT_1363881 [Mycena sp. CBHHK59/15]|nr:hypothetical protein B0H10DRAFT_1363881 [Mycena sp. CBHHK59/15]
MARSASEMIIHCRETIGDTPPRLIGASTTVVGSKMYLFGGSVVSESRLVSDLYVFDLELGRWERILPATEGPAPKPRYYHSADIWKNHLVVFGGLTSQATNMNSEKLRVTNDVQLFDLSTRHWLATPLFSSVSPLGSIPRPRYAHLSAISSNHLFIIGGRDFFDQGLDDICVYDLPRKTWIQRTQHGAHFDMDHAFTAASRWHVSTPSHDALSPVDGADQPDKNENQPNPSPLSYSTRVTKERASDIYVCSNYNYKHLERQLRTLSPLPDGGCQIKDLPFEVNGQPASFRSPTGTILGDKLIVAGHCIGDDNRQYYSIWALSLATYTWSRIDTGDLLNLGSWSRGCLWHDRSKFIVFGNRTTGVLHDDSQRWILGWEEMAVVDLEALGIYQPPPLKIEAHGQRLGLKAIADGRRADFDFICEDDRRIRCSRKIIVERWPWFQEQQARIVNAANGTPVDPKVTLTTCSLGQSYPVTMALLQYFYSMSLVTALQRAPAVLSHLLLIATQYRIPHLQALVKHAMHLALSEATAAGVYDIAASCGCRGLQIRAFLVHTARKKNTTEPGKSKPIGRARSNSEGTRPRIRSERSTPLLSGSNPLGSPPSASRMAMYATDRSAEALQNVLFRARQNFKQ